MWGRTLPLSTMCSKDQKWWGTELLLPATGCWEPHLASPKNATSVPPKAHVWFPEDGAEGTVRLSQRWGLEGGH